MHVHSGFLHSTIKECSLGQSTLLLPAAHACEAKKRKKPVCVYGRLCKSRSTQATLVLSINSDCSALTQPERSSEIISDHDNQHRKRI